MRIVAQEVYLCPVCNKQVEETPKGNIAGHCDTAGAPCPMSFEQFSLAFKIGIPEMNIQRRDLLVELKALQRRTAEIIDTLMQLDR